MSHKTFTILNRSQYEQPSRAGYFIGGVAPAQLDFRVFTLGNCWAILSSLATREQTGAILDLYEQKWVDLIADMPLKICYPAMVGEEWRIVTGCDPKVRRCLPAKSGLLRAFRIGKLVGSDRSWPLP